MQLPLELAIERRGPWAWFCCRGDIVGLVLRIDGRLGLRLANGEAIEVEVDGSTSVFSHLIVLRYRRQGRVDSLVLPRAVLGTTAHRRLRVWLSGRARAALNAAV